MLNDREGSGRGLGRREGGREKVKAGGREMDPGARVNLRPTVIDSCETGSLSRDGSRRTFMRARSTRASAAGRLCHVFECLFITSDVCYECNRLSLRNTRPSSVLGLRAACCYASGLLSLHHRHIAHSSRAFSFATKVSLLLLLLLLLGRRRHQACAPHHRQATLTTPTIQDP